MELLPPPPGTPFESVSQSVSAVHKQPTTATLNHKDARSSGKLSNSVHFSGIATPASGLRRGPRVSSLRLGTSHRRGESSANTVIDMFAKIRVTTPVSRGLVVERELLEKIAASNTDVVILVNNEAESMAHLSTEIIPNAASL